MENRQKVETPVHTRSRKDRRWKARMNTCNTEPDGNTDITLQEHLHFMQILIDAIPSPIFYKDKSNRYLGCNKAFENRLGLSKEEIIGKSAYDIFPKEVAEKYHKMDSALLRQPGEQAYEDTLVYADGKLHHVIIKKGTFTNLEGALAGLLGITVDITHLKEAEEQLRKTHEELEIRVEERTRELAEANEKLKAEITERRRMEEALQESTEKLKFFAFSVMHDLKSPATGIYGLTRLLQRQYKHVLDEKGRTYCSQIFKASEHLATLIEEINIYIATKETPLRIEKINVKEILRDLRDEFSLILDSRRIEWFEPESIPEIKGDRLGLLRVFRNFVDNALKYAGEALSEIKIGYEESEQFHCFSFGDDGIGIKKENLDGIFGPFQRNETSKGTKGAGLGLAIVKEIAERHRGSVWVTPGDQAGTTFCISIAKDL